MLRAKPGVVDRLVSSEEPSIRWKMRVHVLGEDPDAAPARRLQEEVRRSPRVRALLDGHASRRPSTYNKWLGGHWVLQSLADLGYPAGDEELASLRDEVLRTWLAPKYLGEKEVAGPGSAWPRDAVAVVEGRARRCGSQQGGALLALSRLGLADDGVDRLADRLVHWQWPDGGWNCDRDPGATSSSVYETLLPMRGLAAHAKRRGGPTVADAARRAAEVLLTRRLLFRRTTGGLVRAEWAKLHYPVYWHYDVLAALKGVAEVGLIGDARCQDALDLLLAKRLPDGGWPAESRYYRGASAQQTYLDHVTWGGVASGRTNDWVTVDALAVLAAAGR